MFKRGPWVNKNPGCCQGKARDSCLVRAGSPWWPWGHTLPEQGLLIGRSKGTSHGMVTQGQWPCGHLAGPQCPGRFAFELGRQNYRSGSASVMYVFRHSQIYRHSSGKDKNKGQEHKYSSKEEKPMVKHFSSFCFSSFRALWSQVIKPSHRRADLTRQPDPKEREEVTEPVYKEVIEPVYRAPVVTLTGVFDSNVQMSQIFHSS